MQENTKYSHAHLYYPCTKCYTIITTTNMYLWCNWKSGFVSINPDLKSGFRLKNVDLLIALIAPNVDNMSFFFEKTGSMLEKK